MKKVKSVCILIILTGIGLFAGTYFLIPSSKPIYEWCIGLSCAMIILGLGYLVNTLLLLSEEKRPHSKFSGEQPYYITSKQKAGYLVCKIMNILLCIYVLILNEMAVEPFVLILSIGLILIQFMLDLFLQIYLSVRKEE